MMQNLGEAPTLLTWLEHRPFAIAIAESTWMFPITETVHVLALTVVVGSVAMMDVRLLGLGNKERAASEVIENSLPWAWCAFAVAFVAGAFSLALWVIIVATGRWIGFV